MLKKKVNKIILGVSVLGLSIGGGLVARDRRIKHQEYLAMRAEAKKEARKAKAFILEEAKETARETMRKEEEEKIKNMENDLVNKIKKAESEEDLKAIEKEVESFGGDFVFAKTDSLKKKIDENVSEKKKQIREKKEQAKQAQQAANNASSGGGNSSYNASSGKGASGGSAYSTGWSYINNMPRELKKHFDGDLVIGNNPPIANAAAWVGYNSNDIFFSSSEYMGRKGTIYHEMAHMYDKHTSVSQTSRWKQIYNEEWAGTGLYGGTNEKEAWAETVAGYHADSSRLGGSKPKSVQYMKEVLGYVKTQDTTVKQNQSRPTTEGGSENSVATKITTMTAVNDISLYNSIQGGKVGTAGAGSKLDVYVIDGKPRKAMDGSKSTYYWAKVKYNGGFYWIERNPNNIR